MKKLSRKDLENIADRVLRSYKKLPAVVGKPLYRIDPELLCTDVLGLTVGFQHLSLDGSILGLTSSTECGIEVYESSESETFYFLDGKTVLIEENLKTDAKQTGRLNFTISHEAGHQILKMLFPNDYGVQAASSVQYCKERRDYIKPIEDWEEWQADTLGSCLLMPRDLIEQAMFIFCLGDKINILNRIYNPKGYERFKDMANFLGCSMKALSIRMKQLGLLEKEYLDDPYALIEVEV